LIIWITTVGWSPFAVINPFWAYCKSYKEILNKIILIHTPYEKIKENLNICKRYINEILKTYSEKGLNEIFIIEEEIEDDSLELYANMLKRIIHREIHQKPKKIILDITPGRKYMSAINLIFASRIENMVIQVFYLYLHENIYQNIPYPLTPIIKNNLIDVMEFNLDFED